MLNPLTLHTDILTMYCPSTTLLLVNSCRRLSIKIYDKRDDFNLNIINCPYLCNNIPSSPVYGLYISQLIRYARASTNYSDFLEHHKHLPAFWIRSMRKCVSKSHFPNSFFIYCERIDFRGFCQVSIFAGINFRGLNKD